ncbi:MAG: hypothetical protein LUH63_20680 [Parabacteroides sp.]|nr:hypothetical protein [Parabacteroides sp.]
MKQTNLQVTLLCLAALAVASCSNENEPLSGPDNGNENNTPVELGITAGVSLTKSAINGGEQTGAYADTTMKYVAVYAVGGNSGSTDYGDDNNYAIYTRGSNASTWSNTGDNAPKILLTGEKATIYAFHPAHKPGKNSEMKDTEPLTVSSFDATSTIPITVFPGDDVTDADSATITVSPNNADKIYSSGWVDNATAGSILSAKGEVDYMWATSVADRCNRKGLNGETDSFKVALEMNHAMSMVSFRIYNDGTYKGAGKLSQIVLSNVSDGTALTKGTDPKMKVADGEVTPGSAVAVTYTRKIKDSSNNDYFVLKKVGGDDATTTDAQAKEASPKFSILVMPDASASAKNAIQAVFAIDGVDYAVPLAADAESTVKWDKGKNNLYTVKLSGTGLEITSVKVQPWTTNDVTSSGDLEAK